MSKEYSFVGISPRSDGSYRWRFSTKFLVAYKNTTICRYAIYTDLGLDNPEIVPLLTNETQKGSYDMVIHNGDFAYDMVSFLIIAI